MTNQGLFLVLMALLDGPKHGYEISKHIEARSNGFFRMPFGTLYPILHKLEKAELIKGEDNGEKKTYKLTALGRKNAAQEVGEFQEYSKAMNRLVPG